MQIIRTGDIILIAERLLTLGEGNSIEIKGSAVWVLWQSIVIEPGSCLIDVYVSSMVFCVVLSYLLIVKALDESLGITRLDTRSYSHAARVDHKANTEQGEPSYDQSQNL
jgi:hypothetical protein